MRSLDPPYYLSGPGTVAGFPFLIMLVVLAIAFPSSLSANNLKIENVGIASQDASNDYRMVKFDVSWDNSWRTSSFESNWDAAWVFLKWREKNDNVWNHATLNTSGHTAPGGSTINTPSDGKGIFIHRSSDGGLGSVDWDGAEVRWNYGTDGLDDGDSVEVCVFGIEMVKVNQGDFFLGDSSTSDINGHFAEGTGDTPFILDSEASMTLGGGGSNLGNHDGNNMDNNDDWNNSTTQSLPSDFPKGHDAFYMMKYEISQEQYIDFLNKLTYDQQEQRTSQNANNNSGSLAFGCNSRNGITIKSSGVSPSTPAVYASDLDNDDNFDEAEDGQNIACNCLSWADVAAYLDWAGLRPMTEFEYEKGCRGDTSVAFAHNQQEYAWGDTSLTGALDIDDAGLPTEKPFSSNANCAYNDVNNVPGPMRVGCFARSGSNRINSGGTYYGAMELSGNLWEVIVTTGNSTGRNYDGSHGDGALDANGDADEASWPGTNATGTGRKGGSWKNQNEDRLRVSDRYKAAKTDNNRNESFGGRGVRDVP